MAGENFPDVPEYGLSGSSGGADGKDFVQTFLIQFRPDSGPGKEGAYLGGKEKISVCSGVKQGLDSQPVPEEKQGFFFRVIDRRGENAVDFFDKVRAFFNISGQEQGAAAVGAAAGENLLKLREQFFLIVDFPVHDQGERTAGEAEESRLVAQTDSPDMFRGRLQAGDGQPDLGESAMDGQVRAAVVRAPLFLAAVQSF